MNENNAANAKKKIRHIEGPFYAPVNGTQGRTHLQMHGIRFTIDSRVYVTESLKKSLEESARRNISTPILVSARDGKLAFSPASPSEAEQVPPEHRLKTVVNGIETELLATTEDSTPIPVLTQEHIERAKNSYWLRSAYVTWAANEFPQMANSEQLLIMFQ